MKKVSIIVLILILVGAVVYYFSDTNEYTFIAEVDGVSFDAGYAYATYTGDAMKIAAGQRNSEGIEIISINLHCSSPGSFSLDSDDPDLGGSAGYCFGKTKKSITVFATKSSYPGRATISALDFNSKKVSGTFEYRAFEVTGAPRAVKVTGSFDDIPIK
jgi:general stress protein CsbA